MRADLGSGRGECVRDVADVRMTDFFERLRGYRAACKFRVEDGAARLRMVGFGRHL